MEKSQLYSLGAVLYIVQYGDVSRAVVAPTSTSSQMQMQMQFIKSMSTARVENLIS